MTDFIELDSCDLATYQDPPTVQKNVDGVSALMILAARGEADEVKPAINAGADAYAKDAKGRSPLDYLRLANCGKSPIIEWHTFDTGGKCDQLDEDEVKQVGRLSKKNQAKTGELNPRTVFPNRRTWLCLVVSAANPDTPT